jgi:hypothetical protein
MQPDTPPELDYYVFMLTGTGREKINNPYLTIYVPAEREGIYKNTSVSGWTSELKAKVKVGVARE